MKKASFFIFTLLILQLLTCFFSVDLLSVKADTTLKIEQPSYPSAFTSLSSSGAINLSLLSTSKQINLNLIDGSITITHNDIYITKINNITYTDEYEIANTQIIITGAAGNVAETTANTISVNGEGYSAAPFVNIKLNSVNIKTSSASAFTIAGMAKVSLILSGENRLEYSGASQNSSYYCGLEVNQGCSLIVEGLEGGSLESISNGSGAGIGAANYRIATLQPGAITINSGDIKASSNSGAGIGGCDLNSFGGNIVINGGNITSSSVSGAGIGGGRGSPGGIIVINGGTIHAYSNANPGAALFGAGIGGGANGASGSIIINGGKVYAYSNPTGSSLCSGIGNGSEPVAVSGSVIITGGSVNANGTNTVSHINPLPVRYENGPRVFLSALSTNPCAADAPITSGSIDDLPLEDSYGLNDVKTDSNGALYFWLPQSANENATLSVTIDNKKYSATYDRTAADSHTETLDDTLSGDASITTAGGMAIGSVLSLSYSNFNVSTNLYFEWKADDEVIGAGTSLTELTVLPQFAGKTITATITSSDVSGSITAAADQTAPYTIISGAITGSTTGDSVVINTAYLREGEKFYIAYKLADLALINTIEFSPSTISKVCEASNGIVKYAEYVVDGNHSADGVIHINAVISHTTGFVRENLPLTIPVKNAVPQAVINTGNSLYTAVVTWSGNPSVFAAATEYTAAITLTLAASNISTHFAPDFALEINGSEAVYYSRDDYARTITFTYKFPATDPYSITEVSIDSDMLIFCEGDLFDISLITAMLTYEDGSTEYVKLNNLKDAAFHLSNNIPVTNGGIILSSYDGERITIKLNENEYLTAQRLTVYTLPKLFIRTAGLTSSSVELEAVISKGSNIFDFIMQIKIGGLWVDVNDSAITGSNSDLLVKKPIDTLTSETDYECRVVVTDCITHRFYTSAISFRTDAAEIDDENDDENDEEDDDEEDDDDNDDEIDDENDEDNDDENDDEIDDENDEDEDEIGDEDDDDGNTGTEKTISETDFDNETNDIQDDPTQNNLNYLSYFSEYNYGNSKADEMGGKNTPASSGESGSPSANKPAEKKGKTPLLIIKPADIPYSGSGNHVQVDFMEILSRQLSKDAEDTEVFMDLSSVKNNNRSAIEIVFNNTLQFEQLDKLVINYPSGIIVEFSAELLNELSQMPCPFRLVTRPGGINLEFYVSDTLTDWYSYQNPLSISAQCDSGGAYTVLIDEANGNAVTRSWCDGNRIYAMIYRTGSYRVANRMPSGFTDVNDYRVDASLKFLAARSIISGIGAAKFQPERAIKYSEIIVLLMQALNIEIGDEAPELPPTISEGAFYYDSLLKAIALSLTNATQIGTEYAMNSDISRGDMYITVYTALSALNMIEPYDLKSLEADELHFLDSSGMTGKSEYAVCALITLIKAGIIKISDDSSLNLNESVTRAEAAQFIYEILLYDIGRCIEGFRTQEAILKR